MSKKWKIIQIRGNALIINELQKYRVLWTPLKIGANCLILSELQIIICTLYTIVWERNARPIFAPSNETNTYTNTTRYEHTYRPIRMHRNTNLDELVRVRIHICNAPTTHRIWIHRQTRNAMKLTNGKSRNSKYRRITDHRHDNLNNDHLSRAIQRAERATEQRESRRAKRK